MGSLCWVVCIVPFTYVIAERILTINREKRRRGRKLTERRMGGDWQEGLERGERVSLSARGIGRGRAVKV